MDARIAFESKVQKGMQHTPRRLTGQSEDLVLPQLSQESFGQGNGQTEISPLQKLVELMNCQAMVRMLCQVDVGHLLLLVGDL
eukprot:symbB.v1.2.018104.t1/scaffold1432.1/size120878/8